MSALGVLFYADRRRLVNAVLELRRKPTRALLWAGSVLALVVLVASRMFSPRESQPALGFVNWFRDAYLWLTVFGFGVALVDRLRNIAGAFSSRAEALFFMRSTLPPALVAAYLQARAVLVGATLLFVRGAYAVAFLIPFGTTPLEAIVFLGLVLLVIVALLSLVLPVAVARGPWRGISTVAGIVLIAFALVGAAGEVLHAFAIPWPLPTWHPQDAVSAATARAWWLLLVPLAFVALTTLLFARAMRDSMPELYAVSIARLDGIARTRSDRSAPFSVVTQRVGAVSGKLPRWARGAAAFVWINQRIAWRGGLGLVVLVVLMASIAGFVLGEMARARPMFLWGLLGPILLPWLTLGSIGALRLARDLRRPLFWLGEVTTAARLSAWAFGGLWRDGLALFFGSLAFLEASRHPRAAAALFVAGLAVGIISRAIGLLTFAALPNATASSPPAAFVRMLFVFAASIPVGTAAVVVGVVLHSVLDAAVTALALTIGVAVLATSLAAWRLNGRLDLLAVA
ncbi:MAG: putative ABC exporter domain-containing protein [Vulcanimicrobiaceae bacterium]